MAFFDQLAERIERTDSIVCVGLDPDPDRLPASVTDRELPRWAFNRRIIDATHEYAAAYKPNAAFYEDPDGWRALEETIAYAHGKNVPVILDAKRGDIGNTARQYATLLDRADAITVAPYMGEDSLSPFLARSDAGVFILCRTSNPGSSDLQKQRLENGDRVFERVADLAVEWDQGNVGLVVGATGPDELEILRDRAPAIPFLVPGIGAQGGDPEAAVEYGLATRPGTDRKVGLVNSSRSIIFAWESQGASFPEATTAATRQLKQQLNQYR